MKRVNLPRGGLVPIAALLLIASLPAVAGAESDFAQARVATHTGGVDFLPDVAYQKAVLTVSGNGETYRYEFAPGEAMTAGVFDPAGDLLADGVYTWELRFVPDEATAATLRAQAQANDGRAPEAWTALNGSFGLRGGLVADPTLAEEQPLRRAADTAAARAGTGAPSSLGGDRSGGPDEDATIGFSADAQARLRAAARLEPVAAGAGLTSDRPAGEDSDAAAIGRSLEPAAAPDDQFSAQTREAFAPRPRSDGSDGRPRS